MPTIGAQTGRNCADLGEEGRGGRGVGGEDLAIAASVDRVAVSSGEDVSSDEEFHCIDQEEEAEEEAEEGGEGKGVHLNRVSAIDASRAHATHGVRCRQLDRVHTVVEAAWRESGFVGETPLLVAAREVQSLLLQESKEEEMDLETAACTSPRGRIQDLRSGLKT